MVFFGLLTAMLWTAPRLAVYWRMPAEAAPLTESLIVDPK